MNQRKFEPNHIEKKWHKKWLEDKTYSPDIKNAKKPYYNLMMFPYPSAEGLHVGNMYAFTGADVYGRYKRMQGYDVFEPIGLDGFGIHSENYALKVGRHPREQAKRAEENFYRQLASIGNGFAWDYKLETYDPKYYKWTQWLFTEMFKNGLAYRKKSPVNWCPSCKTVLADEQVIKGECERCSSQVEKRDLEQWFFKITEFAEQLLSNIDRLDWSNIVKTAQINWIGKSEGAGVGFEVNDSSKYVFIHGHNGSKDKDFFPWLKTELENQSSTVEMFDLPTNGKPNIETQVQFLLEKHSYDENTVILGHSLGCVVALKLIPQLKNKIKKLILVAPPLKPEFSDGVKRPELEVSTDWEFDFEAVKEKVEDIVVLKDSKDDVIKPEHPNEISHQLKARLIEVQANTPHFNTSGAEPAVLRACKTAIKIFTTRPDTLFGATFMVIAPEHEIVASLLNFKFNISNLKLEEIKRYIDNIKSKSDQERLDVTKEKTGVFSGIYVTNPVNNEKIPVWIADYVLSGYGTGAIMAVPAHDQRDFEFATKYNLPIRQVIQQAELRSETTEAYTGPGKLINSGDWNGLVMPRDMNKVLNWLGEKGIGTMETNYHLRDWLISRQRYWGPPIPMVYCSRCAREGKSWFSIQNVTASFAKQNAAVSEIASSQTPRNDTDWNSSGWYPVSEADLPVLLPEVEDWRPQGTGKAPLANHPEFYQTTCPECGGEARRETDVSDTFLDSAWYFLRYSSIDIETQAFDINITKKWLPVDSYIGGAEHSVLHLLYSRFVTSFLHKLKYLDFEEPFLTFRAHGLIVKDGAKMSKSKGNVVIPDEYIAKYGADTLRTYLMFLGPLSGGGDFRDSGIEGIFRFLKRVWTLLVGIKMYEGKEDKSIERLLNKTIKEVTHDIENLTYNTAIARLMEFYNAVSKKEKLSSKTVIDFLKLLAPFAPHMTEELYQDIVENKNGIFKSIHKSEWPVFDETLIKEEKMVIVVQINGKRKGEITIESSNINNKSIVEQKAREIANKQIGNQSVKKAIYVPGRIINFVI